MMRASELIDAPVVDARGEVIGVVRDLRLRRDPASGSFRVIGAVVGRRGWIDEAAHAWGFAEGRTQGPWALARLTAGACGRARFAPAEEVAVWSSEAVRLNVAAASLRPLQEQPA